MTDENGVRLPLDLPIWVTKARSPVPRRRSWLARLIGRLRGF